MRELLLLEEGVLPLEEGEVHHPAEWEKIHLSNEVVRRKSPVPPSGDRQPPPQKRMLVSPPITIQPPTPLPTPTPSPAGTLVAEHRTRPVVPKTVEASKPADQNAEVIPKIPPPAKPAPKEDKKDEPSKAAKAPPKAGQKIKELDRNMWEPKLKDKWL